MDGGQLLVWLEVVPDDGAHGRMGLVCRRHADAMVVPRGWTLDDRRESRPRLFRVSESAATARARPNRKARRSESSGDPEQLTLAMGSMDSADSEQPVDDQLDAEVTVGEIRPLGQLDTDETQAIPWRFEFDERDDLGGVLGASSPLLSRAFRGQQRPG